MSVAYNSLVNFSNRIARIGTYTTDSGIYSVSGYVALTGINTNTSDMISLTTTMGYTITGSSGQLIEKITNGEKAYSRFSDLSINDSLVINLDNKWPLITSDPTIDFTTLGYVIAANKAGICHCGILLYRPVDTQYYNTQSQRDTFTSGLFAITGLNYIPESIFSTSRNNACGLIAGLYSIKRCSGYSPCNMYNVDCQPLLDSSGNILTVTGCVDNYTYLNQYSLFIEDSGSIEYIRHVLNNNQIKTYNSGYYIYPQIDNINLSLFSAALFQGVYYNVSDMSFDDTIKSIDYINGSSILPLTAENRFVANCFNLGGEDV